MKPKPKHNQIVIRIDKNVASNILDIHNYFESDAALIKSLLFYFCYSYQHNPFNYGKLDVQDIAEKMNIDPANLKRRHPNPKQLEGLSKEEIDLLYENQQENPEDRVFDSYLENALYLLRTTTIYYTNGGKYLSKDGKQKSYTKIEEVRFIKDFTITLENPNSPSNSKVSYDYELDEKFTDNLTNFYLNSNPSVLAELRKPNLDDLYLFVKNLRDSLWYKNQTLSATPNFQMLCKLTHNNITRPADRKLKLQKALKKISAYPELGIKSIEWVRGRNSRYKYQPLIEFHPKFASPKEEAISRSKERTLVFVQNIYYHLQDIFQKKYPNYWLDPGQRPINILKWLQKGPESDYDEKKLAYTNAYFKTFHKAPDPHANHVYNFVNNINLINSLDDMKTVINPEIFSSKKQTNTPELFAKA